MKKQILLLCLALISLCGYAQNITVKGVVTSAADKEPMIGLTALIKGTTNGTVTDLDGNYTLNNVPKDAIVVFSMIGYKTQEIKVNGRTTINVVIKMPFLLAHCLLRSVHGLRTRARHCMTC